MELLGYLASILIGLSLGMVGSGGSILTVPVLVYLMGMNPSVAAASSLFIVGSTSLVGGLRAYAKKLVDFKAVIDFGIPSIFSIFITRHYLFPALPATIYSSGNYILTKDVLLMIVFAVLMLAASFTMIKSRYVEKERNIVINEEYKKVLPLVLLGFSIGIITGFLGAGGGFLIIPTLVLFLRLPMKTAVGTSLLIIAINSLLGFLFSLKQFTYDWTIIFTFTLLAITGIFIGSKLADKIPNAVLKKIFGWFVLAMGIYIIINELIISRSH